MGDEHARPVPQPAERTYKVGRAAFLGLSAATVGALAIGKVHIPSFALIPSIESVNGFTIYTVTGGYPFFSPSTFRLQVDGMVSRPLTLSLEQILREPSVTETRNYQCVTGWRVPHVRWTGIRLSTLLDRAQPNAAAGALTLYSFDGSYTESLTMEQARASDVLLAYKLNGKPLLRSQGAPLRLVVPGMYGYKFIKWLDRIEVVRTPVQGYWEQRGYDRNAYFGNSNGRA